MGAEEEVSRSVSPHAANVDIPPPDEDASIAEKSDGSHSTATNAEEHPNLREGAVEAAKSRDLGNAVEAFFESTQRGARILDDRTGDAVAPEKRPWWKVRHLAMWRGMQSRIPDKDGGRQVMVSDAQGVAIGDHNVQYNIFTGDINTAEADFAEARKIFIRSLRDRDAFIGKFLGQALRQADSTFRLSLVFMTMGGLIVLIAGALALLDPGGSVRNSIALVSGLGGVIVGTSGAAFWIRADRSRKHLAEQAERMHLQLLDERRFSQVVDILSDIKDPNLNDRARVNLALKLMEAGGTSWPTDGSSTATDPNDITPSAAPDKNRRARRNRRR